MKLDWCLPNAGMKLMLKKMAGRQAVGFVTYGVLLLCFQADTLIVGFLGGSEMAGQFVILWKIPEAISLLLWRIPSTIEPYVIQMDSDGNQKGIMDLFLKGRKRFTLLVAIATVSYLAFGPWLTQMWVGEQYAPNESWMYWVASGALFFNAFARWPVSFAYAMVRLRSLVYVASLELISKLALTVLLFPYVSYTAPIIAVILVHLLFVGVAYQKLI